MEEKERPEWVDNLEKRLMTAIESQSELILKRMEGLEKSMDKKIVDMKVELQESVEKVKEIDQRAIAMEKELREENNNIKDQLIVMECKLLENTLRLRGIPESRGNEREEIINILSEFLEKSQDDIEEMCEDLYRVNSDYARHKNLPRDVIIKLTTHKARDTILTKHFQDPMMVLNKRVKI